MYTFHTDSSDTSGRNLGNYSLSSAPHWGHCLVCIFSLYSQFVRKITSHYLFCLQRAKSYLYVTERCCWVCRDYLRYTGRWEGL